jgi:hypothetical protein
MRLYLEEFQEAAMSHHWRTAVGRPDPIQGAGDHDMEYFGGWAISGAMALATIFVLWHFHI